TVNASINEGESYTLPNGEVVTQAGQYVTVLQTVAGCPNTITTILSVINTTGGCYAATVIESNTIQGNRKNGMPVIDVRSNTAQALGAPDAVVVNVVNFYTLGFGGYLTVKFDQPVANGTGNDIRVHEATWNNTCSNYPERAEVFGSQDGCNFLYMGEVCHSGNVAIPEEMAWIQYVQIRDISNPASFAANDDGFDVAGVECLHGAATNLVMADLTDGTLQSIPTYLPGTTKNGNQIPLSRRNKNQAIGLPGGAGINFVSLGFGGSLIGKFDYVVFNKEGLDVQVIETSFGNPACANYPEEAEISVSKDGVTFSPISEICQDGSLDLGSLGWIQYVKIVDSSPIGSSRFNGAADGYDVDGVVDLHACSNGANSRMSNKDNITEPDAEWTANLYPNPTSDRANLELVDLPIDDLITYELFDVTGRLLESEKHQLSDGRINISIDMKHLPIGSYQVRVISITGIKVLKLIRL
ncbi:MAG: T9SS type A sorting domain-containing protein, partial [Bacteroidia bacterium]